MRIYLERTKIDARHSSVTLRFSWVRRHRITTQDAQNGRQQGRSERRGEEVHTKLRLNRSLRSKASG